VVFAQPSLSELHLAVLEAVSVIGHDNISMAELSIPALTTTGLESQDSAERLIASVLSVYQGAVLEIDPVRPKVIVRASA
jgi:DNA-binding LacI/PurR family transcriptional regulator